MSDVPDLDIKAILLKGVLQISFKPMFELHPYNPALAIRTAECEYTIVAESVEIDVPVGSPIRVKSATIVITGVTEE